MTDIQFQLLSAGLVTSKKIENINRQKAIDEAFLRIAGQVKKAGTEEIEGFRCYAADSKILNKFWSLKEKASKKAVALAAM